MPLNPRLIVTITPELQSVIEAMARDANLSLSSTARWMLVQQARASSYGHLVEPQNTAQRYNGVDAY